MTVSLGMLGVPTGTDFADAAFDVSGNGWGYHIGVMFKATDRLSFGARYLSQVKINYTGTASFTQVATGHHHGGRQSVRRARQGLRST